MDPKTKRTIRNKALKIIWNEMKNEITMKDLALALDIPIATFFRSVKEETLKVDNK